MTKIPGTVILLCLPILVFANLASAENQKISLLITPLSVPYEALESSKKPLSNELIAAAERNSMQGRAIGATEYSSIWFAIVKEMGGLYSPMTGRIIPQKRLTAVHRLIDELANKYAMEYIVFPSLEIKNVRSRESAASWDGVRRRVRIYGQNIAPGDNEIQLVTDVKVVSLRLDIYNRNKEWITTSYGGINLLNRFKLRRGGELRIEENKKLYRSKYLTKAAELTIEQLTQDLNQKISEKQDP